MTTGDDTHAILTVDTSPAPSQSFGWSCTLSSSSPSLPCDCILAPPPTSPPSFIAYLTWHR